MAKTLAICLSLVTIFNVNTASAERVTNNIAIFSALEKVTASIETIEINIDETKQFGVFKITPRVCYTRTSIERPQTTSFVEVDEVSTDELESKRVFTGWMFASSPGLHGVEHPVYDIWLKGCKKG